MVAVDQPRDVSNTVAVVPPPFAALPPEYAVVDVGLLYQLLLPDAELREMLKRDTDRIRSPLCVRCGDRCRLRDHESLTRLRLSLCCSL